jgi:hypothetical protein
MNTSKTNESDDEGSAVTESANKKSKLSGEMKK